MTPAQVAEARRFHDFALAAIAVRLEVSMEDVRAAVFESRPETAAQTVPERNPALSLVVTPEAVESVAAREARSTASSAPHSDVSDEPTVADAAGGTTAASLASAAPVPEAKATEGKAEISPRLDAASDGVVSRPSVGGGTDAPIQPETANEAPERSGARPADPLRSEAATREDAGPTAQGPHTQPADDAASRKTVKSRVLACHTEHPDWTKHQIAEHLGLTLGSVGGHLSQLHITGVRNGKPSEPKLAKAAPAPTPAPQRQTLPAVIPPLPAGATLKDRVARCHAQHPTWTARMIANDIGAKESSISTLLAVVRREATGEAAPATPDEQEFVGEADLKAHYAGVGKRLGRVGA